MQFTGYYPLDSIHIIRLSNDTILSYLANLAECKSLVDSTRAAGDLRPPVLLKLAISERAS